MLGFAPLSSLPLSSLPTGGNPLSVSPGAGAVVFTGFPPSVSGALAPTSATTGSDATTYRLHELSRQERRRRKLRHEQAARLRQELAEVEREAQAVPTPEAETIRATAQEIAAEIAENPQLPPSLAIFARKEFQRHFPEAVVPEPRETEEYKALSGIVGRLRQAMVRAADAGRIETARNATLAAAAAEHARLEAEDEDDIAMLLMSL